MDREEIIRMAREAGMQLAWIATVPDTNKMKVLCDFDQVQHFATIIAAAEREACARLCDQMFHDWCNQEFEDEDEAYRNKPDAEDCKKAIRARGEK